MEGNGREELEGGGDQDTLCTHAKLSEDKRYKKERKEVGGVSLCLGRRGNRNLMDTFSVYEDERIPEIDSGDDCTKL